MIKHKGFWAFLMLIPVIMVVVTTFYSCQNLISEKQKVNSIEKYLSDLHENKFFNGAIVVSDDDQIIYSNGFGPANFEKNIAFTVNTPADAGSMTKTLTAAAIFKLIEKGQMRLTDSISTYLPELKYPSIQVKHLLGHSSGIAGDGYFLKKLSGIPSSIMPSSSIY